MPLVKSGGVNIHWETLGTGPPLLMLNGWGASDEHWGGLLPLLAEHNTLILVDNRGVGQSDSPWRPYTADTMADDALAALDAAGYAGQKVNVLGYSLGGVLAQDFAHHHPELVNSLTLLDTTPGMPSVPPYFDVPFKAAAWLLRKVATGASNVVSSAAHLVGLSHAQAAAPATAPHTDAPAAAPPAPSAPTLPPVEPEGPDQPFTWRARIQQLAALLTYSGIAELHNVRVPTLIMHGTNDETIPAINANILHGLLPTSELEWVQGAPHALFGLPQYVPQVSSSVLGFLAKHPIAAQHVVPAASPARSAVEIGGSF